MQHTSPTDPSATTGSTGAAGVAGTAGATDPRTDAQTGTDQTGTGAPDLNDPSKLTAWLNDLLQLDMDAVVAYDVALRELDSPTLRRELEQHLRDHERHIQELERHIERIGGMKMPLPHATGAFKLAVQAAAATASDRKVLLAFKANERQVRDKYQRASEQPLPVEIRDTVRRAAEDEQRHYEWAVRSLEQLGAATDDTDVQAARAFSHVHGSVADATEKAERGMMQVAERTRRAFRNDPVRTVLTAGLAVIGTGMILGRLARRR